MIHTSSLLLLTVWYQVQPRKPVHHTMCILTGRKKTTKKLAQLCNPWFTSILKAISCPPLYFPSDKHNSIMAKAMGLILFTVQHCCSRTRPFWQYVQCILHELTSVLLCIPFIFADSDRCQFGGST